VSPDKAFVEKRVSVVAQSAIASSAFRFPSRLKSGFRFAQQSVEAKTERRKKSLIFVIMLVIKTYRDFITQRC
jgi:hypothetical protein